MVDWNRSPEIAWEKVDCPLCGNPTGSMEDCKETMIIDKDEEDNLFSQLGRLPGRSIEINGQIYPVFTDQCFFKRVNNWYIHTNFPISRELAILIGQIDGVEQFKVDTKYRGIITVGQQFEDGIVKMLVTKIYCEYVETNKSKVISPKENDA